MLKLLDLFCGAGGTSRGYKRAGFHVTGIDIKKPRYRYGGDKFILDDALFYCRENWREYDCIAASPPCYNWSVTASIHGRQKDEYVENTQRTLRKIGLPYIIENVVSAPLFEPLLLCGYMFPELRVVRHRHFETNVPEISVPVHPKHTDYVAHGRLQGDLDDFRLSVTGNNGTLADREIAMGIDWMAKPELSQAIPPAYTEHLGRQLMRRLASG